MEWIDEANKQLAKRIASRQPIIEHEDEIFEALWNELQIHIDDAKKAGFPKLFPSGRDHARVVVLPVEQSAVGISSSSPEPLKLHVTMSKSRHTIEASSGVGYPRVTLHIDVCDDGFVCLMFDGSKISNKDAATRILRPFLFPPE